MVGRMAYRAPLIPGVPCSSRLHGHVRAAKAAKLVADGMADWEMVPKLDRFGRAKTTAQGEPKMQRANAIRLVRRRDWRAKVSGGGDGRPMKVMQLVD